VIWRIVPKQLEKLLGIKSGCVMQAMMQMTRIDIAGLRRAYEQ
jgi:predicted 3-demethylubiquinone-9 3-methyltransferase (glyoxalase superfamily)